MEGVSRISAFSQSELKLTASGLIWEITDPEMGRKSYGATTTTLHGSCAMFKHVSTTLEELLAIDSQNTETKTHDAVQPLSC